MADHINKKKIGIINGGDLCQGALGAFSEDLAEGFTLLGHDATVFPRDDAERLVNLLSDNSYDAIIGIQESLFTKMIGGTYLGDLSDVPKFNILFDTPSFARGILKHPLKNIRYLYQDELYSDFVNEFYPNTSACHFPIGGSMGSIAREHFDPEKKCMDEAFYNDRIYDISFIGYYTDYRNSLRELDGEDEQRVELCLDYFDKLVAEPNKSSHENYKELMHKKAPDIDRETYLDSLEAIYRIEKTVCAYYREQVVGTLIKQGIKIHVFAQGWKKSPYADSPNLVIHDEISYRDSLDIMAQSKMTMNVFSWHKGGMTERISNSLLNGAVCVTDRSSYIDRMFRNGEDMLIYDITKTGELTDSIMELLYDDDKRIRIAKNGFKVGFENNRWINCAQRLLQLL